MSMALYIITALICGVIWLGLTISSISSGTKYIKRARRFKQDGQWEDASLQYKLAIISQLNSKEKVRELTDELGALYKERRIDADFSEILECPEVIKMLGAGTRDHKKKHQLFVQTYQKAAEILNAMPGPKIP